jgi:hypothetical protein
VGTATSARRLVQSTEVSNSTRALTMAGSPRPVRRQPGRGVPARRPASGRRSLPSPPGPNAAPSPAAAASPAGRVTWLSPTLGSDNLTRSCRSVP